MDREQVAYTVGSLLAIYGVTYFVTALTAPGFFFDFLAVEKRRDQSDRFGPSLGFKLSVWRRGIFALIGVGYFTYRATAPLADWLPFDWGSPNEDGEWTSARDTLRFSLTLFGTLWAMTTAERIAKANKPVGD
jgi:hypothetical protein